jgi:hypothetical protein
MIHVSFHPGIDIFGRSSDGNGIGDQQEHDGLFEVVPQWRSRRRTGVWGQCCSQRSDCPVGAVAPMPMCVA